MEDFIGKYNGGQIESRLDKVKDMVGATASQAGEDGLVPAPAKGDEGRFLCGDGTWKDVVVKPDYTVFDIVMEISSSGNLSISQENYNNLSILWTTDDPSNFSDTSYTGYDKKGNICRTNGYAKKMLLGEDGDIVSTEVGGSSSTYWCDYYYTYTSANRMQVVLVGGRADSGSAAGLAGVGTNGAPSDAARNVGSRLCFFPEYRKTSA